MKKVVWVALDGFPPVEGEETLRAVSEAHFYYDTPDTDTFLARCRGAHVIVWHDANITREVIDQLPGLEMLCTLGVGSDHIDHQYAKAKGITICNVPGAQDNGVAEHGLGLMLALARNIVKGDGSMREGKWESFLGKELSGNVMGLVGLGGIGAKLAAMGNSLGMEVLCCTKHPSPERGRRYDVRFVELDDLMSSADFVVLASVLNDETRGMIGRRELALMKSDAYLINIARAAIVDQVALLDVLKGRLIGGYGTDVYEVEPTYDEPLAKLDNVVLTPHVAWVTPETKRRLLNVAMDNVMSYLSGRPQNVVV